MKLNTQNEVSLTENRIKVHLPNDYVVQLFEHEGKAVLALINANGEFLSDTRLNESDIKRLKTLVSTQ